MFRDVFFLFKSSELTIEFKCSLARKKLEVEFCRCTPDQVRLIRQGYLGGSPIEPRTAFSLRLLRFYHIIWKESSTAILAFSPAIDEYLDADNELILVKDSSQVLHFHLYQTLSCFFPGADYGTFEDFPKNSLDNGERL